MNILLLQFLDKLLGNGTPKSKGNVAYHCPFCKHRKQKLEIHVDSQLWECWTCPHKGKTVFSLLRQMNSPEHLFNELQRIAPSTSRKFNFHKHTKDCKLPPEYIPLWKGEHTSFYGKMCVNYLKDRGVTQGDILKYRLGYCSEGMYSGMIIFPNYTKEGTLNFFTTRSFIRNASKKFMNPEVDRNVIGFELQLNPDLPLIIVESALDAIIIKRNACPLYGTQLSKSIKQFIIDFEVSDLYMCLDPDAFNKAMKHIEYFMSNGINVYNVRLPKNSDPNKLGFKEIWKRIDSAKLMTYDKIFEYKVEMGLL